MKERAHHEGAGVEVGGCIAVKPKELVQARHFSTAALLVCQNDSYCSHFIFSILLEFTQAQIVCDWPIYRLRWSRIFVKGM